MSAHHKREAYLHFLVSAAGGYLGCYTIINHCDLFAAAQTSNMIHIIKNLLDSKFLIVIYMLASLFVYASGIALCTLIKKLGKIDIRLFSLGVTALAAAATGLMPYLSNDYLAMMPLIFALPVQWCAFTDCLGYSSSTIFSTNNLRQTVAAFTQYAADKDEKQLKKAKFFGMTLLSYHIGVAAVCLAQAFAGSESIWFSFVPITASILCCLRSRGVPSVLFRSRLNRSKA